MAVDIRPWKSMATSRSSPRTSRTAATRSITAWVWAGVSMGRSCAEPFILTAVKPASTWARASSATSAGRSPPIHAYIRTRSRTWPPSSWWTGTPWALPAMSQSAWSMPATALESTGPPR